MSSAASRPIGLAIRIVSITQGYQQGLFLFLILQREIIDSYAEEEMAVFR